MSPPRDVGDGEPDAACPATVAAAWTAGMTFVDVYAFPVPAGASPAAQQATELLSFLGDHQVTWGRLWLDVESGGHWPDAAASLAFIQAYVDAVTAAGRTVGIYCSTSGWRALTGGTTAFAHLPLWWCSHGASFAPFGGWSAATLVQYAREISRGPVPVSPSPTSSSAPPRRHS